jgi:hypothetical protein
VEAGEVKAFKLERAGVHMKLLFTVIITLLLLGCTASSAVQSEPAVADGPGVTDSQYLSVGGSDQDGKESADVGNGEMSD